MSGTRTKKNYVASQVKKPEGQDANHHCHWPGCDKQVPPALWGCRKHWMKLPKELRDAIWETYRPGQEVTKTPSQEYVKVALKVRAWILDNFVIGCQGSLFQ